MRQRAGLGDEVEGGGSASEVLLTAARYGRWRGQRRYQSLLLLLCIILLIAGRLCKDACAMMQLAATCLTGL